MTPTLRSHSAQNSPTAAGRTSNNNSPSSTPRKAPQCSKCKRPRAGHPRSGCPFAESPSREAKVQDKPDNHLNVAMGSMTLLSPAPIDSKEDKAFIRNRRRLSAQPELAPSDSLLSLSTNSSEIVARLLKPGIFDDTDEEDNSEAKGKISKVVRWQNTIATSPINTPLKIKKPSRSPMPGSLFPPTPESSFASTRTGDGEEISIIIRRSNIAVANPLVASDASAHSASTVEQSTIPLALPMNASQREMFMSELKPETEAKATLCVFDKTDIAAMYAKAVTRHKFAFQVMNDDKNDSQALLVVGQDEEAVHALLRQVEAENERAKAKLKEACSPNQSRPSNLGMAAGGVVVGAVGAWAGLAFS